MSKKADKFLPLLNLNTEIIPAQLRNESGIVGAAAAVKGHICDARELLEEPA